MFQEKTSYTAASGQKVDLWKTYLGFMIQNEEGEVTVQMNDREESYGVSSLSAGLKEIGWQS
jgi:hypothetical protein